MYIEQFTDTTYSEIKETVTSFYNSIENDIMKVAIIEEGYVIRYAEGVYSILCIDEYSTCYFIADNENDVNDIIAAMPWKEHRQITTNDNEFDVILEYITYGITDALNDNDKEDLIDIYNMVFHNTSKYDIDTIEYPETSLLTVIYSPMT